MLLALVTQAVVFLHWYWGNRIINCPSASEASLADIGKIFRYITTIKPNRAQTLCIFPMMHFRVITATL